MLGTTLRGRRLDGLNLAASFVRKKRYASSRIASTNGTAQKCSTKKGLGEAARPIDVTDAILNHVTGPLSPTQRMYDRHNRLPEMRRRFGSTKSIALMESRMHGLADGTFPRRNRA